MTSTGTAIASPPDCFDVGGDFFGFGFLNIGDDDLSAFFGQAVSVSFADADAAAGDDRNFIF